jgi:hypothetical protein
VAAGGNIGDDHPEILAALDRETLNGILAQPESEDPAGFPARGSRGEELTREECETLLARLGK